MKLYSEITSERASKGQGGDKYIFMKLLNGREDEVVSVKAVSVGENIKLRIFIKGKKEISYFI